MNNLFFQQILSLSQDPCQDLIWLTFHGRYMAGKHRLSFQIIYAICNDIYAFCYI